MRRPGMDETMRPAACRPPRGKTPEAAALGEERLGKAGQGPGAGGGGRRARGRPWPELHLRPQSLDAPEAGAVSPQLSLGGLAEAELACSQLSSNDGLLERPPRPAPPGRLEDQPRTRAFWNGAAYDRRAPGSLGLLARDPQEGKAPAGAPAHRPRAPRAEDQASSPWPLSVQPERRRRGRLRRWRVQEGLLPERQKRGCVIRSLHRAHCLRREFGFHFPVRKTGLLRQKKNKCSR